MWNLPVKAGVCDKDEPRKCAGTPNMRTDAHGVVECTNMARDAQEIISAQPADLKPLDLPTRGAAPCTGSLESLESHSDG